MVQDEIIQLENSDKTITMRWVMSDEGEHGIYYVGRLLGYTGINLSAKNFNELKQQAVEVYNLFKQNNINSDVNVYV